MTNIVISGAGPVGCLLALLLTSEDPSLRVLLLEKRPGPRSQERDSSSQLKSINLALSDRGRAALRQVGLEQVVLAEAVEMNGRMIHLSKNESVFQQYDDVTGEKSIYSVSRQRLTELLRERVLASDSVEVRFDCRVTKIDQTHGGVLASFSNGQVVPCRALLGCDGAYSSVREAMSRVRCMDFHRTYIDMGYAELRIPSGTDLSRHALHIWPKDAEGHMMMIALANLDGSFTATLFAPFTTLRELQQNGNFQAFLLENFSECVPLLDKTECTAHPLFTQTVSPWNSGAVALMGDAAHTQVPFFGQGLNAGMEDALVFFELWRNRPSEWETILDEFNEKRRPCGDAITVLSRENYVEMHTSSSRLAFRVSRRIQGLASTILPRVLVSLPLYYQVAFTRRPYDEILREKRQSVVWQGMGVITVVLAVASAALVVWQNRRD